MGLKYLKSSVSVSAIIIAESNKCNEINSISIRSNVYGTVRDFVRFSLKPSRKSMGGGGKKKIMRHCYADGYTVGKVWDTERNLLIYIRSITIYLYDFVSNFERFCRADDTSVAYRPGKNLKRSSEIQNNCEQFEKRANECFGSRTRVEPANIHRNLNRDRK